MKEKPKLTKLCRLVSSIEDSPLFLEEKTDPFAFLSWTGGKDSFEERDFQRRPPPFPVGPALCQDEFIREVTGIVAVCLHHKLGREARSERPVLY